MPTIRFYIPNSTGLTTGITVKGSRRSLVFKPSTVGAYKAAVLDTKDTDLIDALRKDPYYNKRWFEQELQEPQQEPQEETEPQDKKPAEKDSEIRIIPSKVIGTVQEAKKYLVTHNYCRPTDFKKRTVAEIAAEHGLLFEGLPQEAPPPSN